MENINLSPIRNYDEAISIETRKSYSISEKLDNVKLVEKSGFDYVKVSKMTGIHHKLLREWVQDKSRLESESPCRKRLDGGGRKPLNEELDKRLNNFVLLLRSKKFPVNYHMIYEKAIEISKELNMIDFKASVGYIRNFMRRNELAYRSPTHKSQQNNKTVDENAYVALEFLNKLNRRANQFDNFNMDSIEILNMDETPFYFDMSANKTVDVIGKKSIEVVNSGNEKTRFTVTLTISASGSILPAYLIFRGLKKVPNIDYPENIIAQVSNSGTMDQFLMVEYIEKILLPWLRGRPALLILDKFKSHYTPMVLEKLAVNNISMVMVPAGMTDRLQPLDVSINGPLKTYFRSYWVKWLIESEPIWTKTGKRQRPSYQCVVEMLSLSTKKLTRSVIIEAFKACGLRVVDSDILNTRLRETIFISGENPNRDTKLFSIMRCDSDEDVQILIKDFINAYKGSYVVPAKTRKRKILHDILNVSSISPNNSLNDTLPLIIAENSLNNSNLNSSGQLAVGTSSPSSIIIETTSSLIFNSETPSTSFTSPFSISSILSETSSLLYD